MSTELIITAAPAAAAWQAMVDDGFGANVDSLSGFVEKQDARREA